MPINSYHTVLQSLDRHARLNGETDKIDYPRRCGAAEAKLMIALSHVCVHHGEEAARQLAAALEFDIIESVADI